MTSLTHRWRRPSVCVTVAYVTEAVIWWRHFRIGYGVVPATTWHYTLWSTLIMSHTATNNVSQLMNNHRIIFVAVVILIFIVTNRATARSNRSQLLLLLLFQFSKNVLPLGAKLDVLHLSLMINRCNFSRCRKPFLSSVDAICRQYERKVTCSIDTDRTYRPRSVRQRPTSSLAPGVYDVVGSSGSS